jgi:hypothetical protein
MTDEAVDTLTVEVNSGLEKWYPFLNYVEFIENIDKVEDMYNAVSELYVLSKIFKCKHKGQYKHDCEVCVHRFACLTRR